jgi:hypothetical protein
MISRRNLLKLSGLAALRRSACARRSPGQLRNPGVRRRYRACGKSDGGAAFQLHRDGQKETVDGVYPTNHQEHETLELTEGINVQGLGLAPSAKVSYDFTRVVSAGFEYYADYGALRNFATTHDQQQQLFLVTDLNVSPVWEINFGVGIGATGSTDHLIVKAILGRRFDWGRHSAVD